MIRSVGTLYAIQDLFDHLAAHSVAKDDFVTGFAKYGTSTAEDVYETATQLSWICTAESGQIVPTILGQQAHDAIGRPGKLRCQLAKIIEATHPAWAALLPKGRTEALVGFPQEIRQCFEEAQLLGDATDDVPVATRISCDAARIGNSIECANTPIAGDRCAGLSSCRRRLIDQER